MWSSLAIAAIITTGPSAAWRQECEGHRYFVKQVVTFKEQGKTLNEIQSMLLARAIQYGLPSEVQDSINRGAEAAYQFDLKPAEAGELVYNVCMKNGRQ